jgi:hypothetical protein
MSTKILSVVCIVVTGSQMLTQQASILPLFCNKQLQPNNKIIAICSRLLVHDADLRCLSADYFVFVEVFLANADSTIA